MSWPLTAADRARLAAVADSWGPPTPEQRVRLRPLLAGTLDHLLTGDTAGTDAMAPPVPRRRRSGTPATAAGVLPDDS
jgi:hypothetical protein